ncbi:4-alpha-glucanotransferase [Roseateles violae]|uniref:4-alpha-glucanotransferase n=1 Tax=Roseateles violae TaxID=3058042 RepID=A0ABT8DV44_9BURK|nr:4-alpha-glucanotransferase [Pelomonas sp. PFR6]MDN3921951.1 4-alpha-glucanotransferase [Pelomonas sp. PFR6]
MDLNQRSSGVLLHITSLPGPHGIGDFGPDAYRFVDWLASAGQRLWQLLPTTPIGPGDSPYQGVSAFAGSQWMVALEPLIQKGWLAAPQVPSFDPLRVNYGEVLPWREAQLRAAAAGFFAKASAADRADFAAWCEAQQDWLADYALFMAIRSPLNGQPWWQWPAASLMRREPAALAQARKDYAQETAFWNFVQWQFDRQSAALKAYANGKGVAIMGDLPIFVAHDSADCWSRPDLYHLDENFNTAVVAGVPPDAMSVDGQRWGNPLYRWERMAEDGYAWWTARVRRALSQADVFRIDHFRGFAGYYEIPGDAPDAKQGRWLQGPGKALFDAIEQALGKLPIVAEDLGFITEDVHQLRDGCGFPGMKILQFGFGGEADHEFLPHMWPRASVAYTGTHDNDTVRGWWDAASPRERAFAGSYLACGEQDVHWAMIRGCANSVANMAVYPLQDVLGLPSAHRMNVPGVLGGNWSWRFAWDMIGAEPGRVLGLITAASGRGPFELLRLPA